MITATCCKITKKEITVLQFLRWGDMSTIKRFTVSPANFRNIIWSDATKMSMKRNDFYVVCDIHLKIWRSVFQSRASFWISNGYQRLKGIPYNFKSYWKVSEQKIQNHRANLSLTWRKTFLCEGVSSIYIYRTILKNEI